MPGTIGPSLPPSFQGTSLTPEGPSVEKKRLFSPKISPPQQREVENAKRACTKSLHRLGKDLSPLQTSLLPVRFAKMSAEEVDKTLTEKREALEKMKESLKNLEGELATSTIGLSKKDLATKFEEFQKLSSAIQSLETSLQIYEKLKDPDVSEAIKLAQETQNLCQRLDTQTRKNQNFNNIRETLREMQVIKESLQRQLKLGAENDVINKILNDAKAVLAGTIQAGLERVEQRNPVFAPWHTARKTIFEGQKTELEGFFTQTLSDLPTANVLHETLSSSSILHRQIADLSRTMGEIELQISELLEKYSAGKVGITEEDKTTLNNLTSALNRIKQEYGKLQPEIGKSATSTQFIEQAICQASVLALQERLNTLTALFTYLSSDTFRETTNQILQNLASAVHDKGQERATAFYKACHDLEDLTNTCEAFTGVSDPVAKNILQSRINQLRNQLESASQAIFAKDSEEQKAAARLARAGSSSLSKQESQQATAFLTKAMTQLLFFDDGKLEELKAMVDLCLAQRTREDNEKDLPEGLLKAYEQLPPSPGWTDQIQTGKEITEKFQKILSLKSTDIEQMDAYVRTEKELQELKKSLPPSISTIVDSNIHELKNEHFITLTSEEQKVLTHIPSTPTSEQKAILTTALSKLMLQALYAPVGKEEARAQAIKLMNDIGSRIEYRSVFEEIGKHEALEAFRADLRSSETNFPTLEPTKDEKKQLAQAKEAIDQIFRSSSNLWLHNIMSVDMLPSTIKLGAEGRREVEEYLTLHKELSLLQNEASGLAKKEPSWETASQLLIAYTHVSSSKLLTYPDRASNPFIAYAERSHITEDKKRMVNEIVSGKGDYYKKRVSEEKNEEIQTRRIYAILGPLLLSAMTPEGTIDPNFKKILSTIVKDHPNLDNPTFLQLLTSVFQKNPTVSALQQKLIASAEAMKKEIDNPTEFFRLRKEVEEMKSALHTEVREMIGEDSALTPLKNHLEAPITATLAEADTLFQNSKAMKKCVSEAKQYAEQQVNKLRGMPLAAQRAFLSSDGFKDGLNAILKKHLGDPIPWDILGDLKDRIFDVERMKKEVTDLYHDLQTSFSPQMFGEYKKLMQKFLLSSMLPFAGSYFEGSSDQFKGAQEFAGFKPNEQAKYLQEGSSLELKEALQKLEPEVQPYRKIFSDLEIRPKAGKTPEAMTKDMRHQFQGIEATIETRLNNMREMKAQLENSSKNFLVTPDQRQGAIENLRVAIEKLEAFQHSLYNTLSDITKDKLREPGANKVALFREDPNLSPEAMQKLLSDSAIQESIHSLIEATQLTAGDPLLLENMQNLVTGFSGSTSLTINSVLRFCGDAKLRGPMIDRRDSLGALGNTVVDVQTPFSPTTANVETIVTEKSRSRQTENTIATIKKDKNHPLRQSLIQALTVRHEKAPAEEKDLIEKDLKDLS